MTFCYGCLKKSIHLKYLYYLTQPNLSKSDNMDITDNNKLKQSKKMISHIG